MIQQCRMILFLLLGGCSCIPDKSSTKALSNPIETNLAAAPGCRILDIPDKGVHKITCEDGRIGFHIASN